MTTLSIPRPILRAPQRVAALPCTDGASLEAAPIDGLAGIDSGSLLRGSKCVQIAHNGSLYKLQSTKLGKLILTK
jgi:hemin uptake protein HemP